MNTLFFPASRGLLHVRKYLVLAVLFMSLTACGGGKWGFPYRIDVQQGNWITASQVEQLEIGMTREQVRFILGTPTLQDIFFSDRWEYPYYLKPGYGDEELRTFTVWFDGDHLVRWEGSKQPDRQPFERADSGVQRSTEQGDAPIIDPADQPDPTRSADLPQEPTTSPVIVDTPPAPAP